jgi:hypothetical protein
MKEDLLPVTLNMLITLTIEKQSIMLLMLLYKLVR